MEDIHDGFISNDEHYVYVGQTVTGSDKLAVGVNKNTISWKGANKGFVAGVLTPTTPLSYFTKDVIQTNVIYLAINFSKKILFLRFFAISLV